MPRVGLFGLSEHLEQLSKNGDPVEVPDATIDFQRLRPSMFEGFGYGDGLESGRPPLDPVAILTALMYRPRQFFSG